MGAAGRGHGALATGAGVGVWGGVGGGSAGVRGKMGRWGRRDRGGNVSPVLGVSCHPRHTGARALPPILEWLSPLG